MSWIRTILTCSAAVPAVALSLAHLTAGAADAPAPSFYVLKGDYSEISSKGSIRFLVHGVAEYLPRAGDPRAAERALAEQLANRLGVKAVFIPVAEQDDLIDELNEGHGDVIVGSLAITAGRNKRIAFSRPIRFVDQLVVVHASDTSIQGPADLAGKEVTVREGSSYAEALDSGKVKGVRLKVAPQSIQTLDILQKVGRGEEKITVADSDLFAAATAFAPNIRSAFKLVEKQPIAWGLRRNNPDLKSAIDSFLVEHALTQDGEETYFADLDEPGHVADARDLAKQMGLDPHKWFGNVEKSMLLLSNREIAKKVRYGYCRCEEPVNYVSQIQDRYDHYVQIVPMREVASR